ncbi:MAG TPA: PAS domain-containing sensor histidine kinase [Hanamia sp.]|nr:PAS domain-containing sensor histidine kinase [Hanamia sp.]
MQVNESHKLAEDQIKELRQQLEEANEMIEAIRNGQIDALVVKDDTGPKVYTLKTADQTYRVFIEKMREGAVTLNKKGLILYSNTRFASMLNLSLEKIIGSYFKDYIDSSFAESFDALFEHGWHTECKGEVSFLTADGKSIPVLLSLTNLELDEGLALSIIITDLTDQKKIEQELRDNYHALEEAKSYTEKLNNDLEMHVRERTEQLMISREHFKFMADTIPVIVWRANARGEYNYFNRLWYEYTGLTFEESKGDGWQTVIHPNDLEKTVKEWELSVATGTEYKSEDRKRSKNGVYRWHLVNALPFKDREGNILQWFGVCTDIEDQKKDMQKKDEFISMASHELKTPVTSLKVFNEILLMDAERKENKNESMMLKKMDKQIDKLTHLIGDLLDVSKTNSGQLSYDFETINFNDVVIETVNVLQLSTSHQLRLNLGEPTFVLADKNRLGQVITNLVSNAVKYSPHSLDVDIYTEKSNGRIRLCVRDYGIGIPVSEQSKLFSRFFRVSENNYPGLGLGLYICKEIIRRHSGTMSFETEEGKGSTFCFSIPVKGGGDC